MPRVKRSVHAKKKRRKILKLAKGNRGSRSMLFRIAIETVERGLCYAYRDRRSKKREMRGMWIARINAAARANGISYSRLMDGLTKSGVALDRKSLAEMAANDPGAFTRVADMAKASLVAA
jgi:large subunit ribosomal protein L20